MTGRFGRGGNPRGFIGLLSSEVKRLQELLMEKHVAEMSQVQRLNSLLAELSQRSVPMDDRSSAKDRSTSAESWGSLTPRRSPATSPRGLPLSMFQSPLPDDQLFPLEVVQQLQETLVGQSAACASDLSLGGNPSSRGHAQRSGCLSPAPLITLSQIPEDRLVGQEEPPRVATEFPCSEVRYDLPPKGFASEIHHLREPSTVKTRTTTRVLDSQPGGGGPNNLQRSPQTPGSADKRRQDFSPGRGANRGLNDVRAEQPKARRSRSEPVPIGKPKPNYALLACDKLVNHRKTFNL